MYSLQALDGINNKRALFEVRPAIKVISTPRLGLGQSLTLNGYSSGLMQFTWSRPIYNCMKISPNTIIWPSVFALMFGARFLYEIRIVLMVFCADWFIFDRCWCRPKLENEIYISLWLIRELIHKWQEMNDSKFVREMIKMT